MRGYRHLVVIGLVAMSAVVAADALQIRPGRWQVTMALDFPEGKKPPAGMPFAEPMTDIACITAADLAKWGAPIPPPEGEGCKVSNFKATGREYSYSLHCEDMSMDLKATVHSPDSYSAFSKSHGKDPSQQLMFRFSGKRIGDACSAEELAKQNEE